MSIPTVCRMLTTVLGLASLGAGAGAQSPVGLVDPGQYPLMAMRRNDVVSLA